MKKPQDIAARLADIARVGNHAAKVLSLDRVVDLADFLAPHLPDRLGLVQSSALDLGCGLEPFNPFGAAATFGVDIREHAQRNVRHADLTVEPIPFDNDAFDYVTAFDFIEHIPRVIYAPARRFPFVELMNEVWRVAKPGGLFLSHTPIYPFSESFRDPTHTNILSHETLSMYFAGGDPKARMYGFTGNFEIVRQGMRAPHLVCLMRKLPPGR